MKNRPPRTRIQQTKKSNPDSTRPKISDPLEVSAISSKQFEKYLSDLEQKNGDIKCEACGGVTWMIPPDAVTDDKPLIITLPLPLHQGLGMWSLPIICAQCGNMKLFSAPHIVKSLKKEEEA